jgi:hypothetical protein
MTNQAPEPTTEHAPVKLLRQQATHLLSCSRCRANTQGRAKPAERQIMRDHRGGRFIRPDVHSTRWGLPWVMWCRSAGIGCRFVQKRRGREAAKAEKASGRYIGPTTDQAEQCIRAMTRLAVQLHQAGMSELMARLLMTDQAALILRGYACDRITYRPANLSTDMAATVVGWAIDAWRRAKDAPSEGI